MVVPYYQILRLHQAAQDDIAIATRECNINYPQAQVVTCEVNNIPKELKLRIAAHVKARLKPTDLELVAWEQGLARPIDFKNYIVWIIKL